MTRTAIPFSGKEAAAAIRTEAAQAVAALTEAGTPVKLAVVTATDDDAAAWYVRSIASAARRAGIDCEIADLGPEAATDAIIARIAGLSADDRVSGIILQTPLPHGVPLEDLTSAIDPAKDVDGANPVSLGRLAAGLPAFGPATAEAVVAMLDFHGVQIAGRHAVVVGRSTVVGKPAALMLLARDASVTVCHSRSVDLAAFTSRADILVAAAGRAGLIRADHVKAGAVVIDVGTNPTPEGDLTGDVDAASVAQVAGALTPVPGGVGPLTTALLLRHTVAAAQAVAAVSTAATATAAAERTGAVGSR
jgi:methylenetetrahydrofolate dehydrogenase (NADP+) / methenyltetrahydrofolate cyclohydrolase